MSERGSTMPVHANGPTDFTVHQLTIFRTVAHHLSYTKAAEALYLSQPSVSQQVKISKLIVGLQLCSQWQRHCTDTGRPGISAPYWTNCSRFWQRLLL